MKYTIIGSGVTGVNAALTLLERGKEVVMYDVGEEENKIPLPQYDFYNLKDNIQNPYEYFLGDNAESILPPCDNRGFIFPPSRNFHIKTNNSLTDISSSSTFKPILSHTKGGLGVAWGANALEFNDYDLSSMGLMKKDFHQAYEVLSKRMSIAGPAHDNLSGELKSSITYNRPLNLSAHEHFLLKKSEQIFVKNKGRMTLGRARMAVETRLDESNQCIYCGRCIWGCDVGAIYNPENTLKKCFEYNSFEYIKNTLVVSLVSELDSVVSMNLYETKKKKYFNVKCEKVLLAAGAINSAAIFLRTLNDDSRYKNKIPGYSYSTKSLLDTSVVKLPYVYPKMICKNLSLDSMQYNKLIIGYVRDNPGLDRYIHGEIVTLSSLLYHPIIEEFPFSSKINLRLFKYLKNSIGVVTYFLPDQANNKNFITLQRKEGSITSDELCLNYSETEKQHALKRELKDVTRRYFKSLGCYMPKSSYLFSEIGAGIHYAGTIPYSKHEDKRCTDISGRCYAYKNLYVLDGATLPALPSKSITLNLIANSIRISSQL